MAALVQPKHVAV